MGIFTHDGERQKVAPLLRDVAGTVHTGTSMNSLQSRVQQLYFRSRQGVTGRQNLNTRSTVHIYCIITEIYKKKDMDRKCLCVVYETTTELVTVCTRTSRRCVGSVCMLFPVMGMHGPDGNCGYHFPPLCFTASEISAFFA